MAADILAALNAGELYAATLDVFAVEPPVDSPLLEAPNTVLAPHLGAQTVDAQVAVSVEVARQIVEFFAASRR